MAVELINQVAFPIAAFVLIFRQYRDERDQRREEREQWRKQIEELTEVMRGLRREVSTRPERSLRTDGGDDNE